MPQTTQTTAQPAAPTADTTLPKALRIEKAREAAEKYYAAAQRQTPAAMPWRSTNFMRAAKCWAYACQHPNAPTWMEVLALLPIEAVTE